MYKIKYIIICVTMFFFTAQTSIAEDPAVPFMNAYSDSPIYSVASSPPLVMLVMGRDHKLYYEAYNDASDLDGDGTLDIGYKGYPGYGGKQYGIDYYGYFDSYKCYIYNSSNNRFEPSSETADKKCSGLTEWSGDFLNYLTMSRMDTMRKVFYGGYRSTDTTLETVLERVFVPQDGHTWGKEYQNILNDGYDIRDYTPLNLPAADTRHLFASTTLGTTSPPLLRVLNDSQFRIWEWVARESPVGGSNCGAGSTACAKSASASSWNLVPAEAFSDFTQTTYDITGSSHPADHSQFDVLETTYGVESKKLGSGTAAQINGEGNPFGADDYYMTIFEGKLNIPEDGVYTFAIDGDDAIELIIDNTVVAAWYGGHGKCSCQTHTGSISLSAGQHVIKFRHEEQTGSDNYYLYYQVGAIPDSYITDYHARVQVCKAGMLEDNCKEYVDDSGNSTYKPVGILQKHGENDQIYFGLMTGSYVKNMSGGVVRKNIGSIKDEINLKTGQFATSVNGIIQTINKLRISDFNYTGHTYAGLEVSKPMPESSKQYPDWGNPVAEMMYETLRYFADGENATSDYDYTGTLNKDYILGLPKETWADPFIQNSENLYCSKPIMLVISDIYPSYDSDELPGTSSIFAKTGWSSGAALGSSILNVKEVLDDISSTVNGDYYLGHVGSVYDSSCSPKTVDKLGNARGLCPEEPTKQGSYYSAAVSYYGNKNDLRPDLDGNQLVDTYAVALSSPLPEIKIPVGDQFITLVPFGKSVNYGSSINISPGAFQPTLTIVDFFIQELAPDGKSGKIRINFEDVEQGNDHDMDVIVRYDYAVQDDNTLKITLTKEYEAAGIVMHMGYIISGTTKDGIYLDIASQPTNDPLYFLDTPMDRNEPGRGSSTMKLSHGIIGDSTVYSRERTFTPSSDIPATLLKDPLWYSAKWGSGDDWDKNNDGVPDNYYYVINPLQLEKQLNKAFSNILEKAGSGTSASVLATNKRGDGNILQAFFRPAIPNHENVRWLGYLQNLWLDKYGNIRENTNGQNADGSYSLDPGSDKIIEFISDLSGDTTVRKYSVSDADQYPDLSTASFTTHSIDEIIPIWEAGKKLMAKAAGDRKIYTYIGDETAAAGYLSFGSGDFIEFKDSNVDSLKNWLGVLCPVGDDSYDYLGTTQDERAVNLINYVRGTDIEVLRPRTINDDDGNPLGVWKLGDIVNSSPVIVSKPTGQYHLLYGDKGYQTYFHNNRNRETVVYVGANDGQLHAFTSWIYENGKYVKPTGTTEGIGEEIWSFIPKSLLPHLKWLPDPDYSHVYYVDQMPLVADVKIDVDNDGITEWRTILVAGLRMGGNSIGVYGDFDSDGINENKRINPTYFCLDVTEPRSPKLLWERTYANMGFSFSVPVIVRNNGIGDDWHLVFGSGPTDYTGSSSQKGLIFVVDLKTGDPQKIFEGQENSFFTSASIIDKDLKILSGNSFSHDNIYLAESYKVFDNEGNWAWNSKISVIDTFDNTDLSKLEDATTAGFWGLRNIFSVDAPITASLSVSTDENDNSWIIGGTGRYLNQSDKSTTDQQYLFGFKDPLYNPGHESSIVSLGTSNLYRVDNLVVTKNKDILDKDDSLNIDADTPDWNTLLEQTDYDASDINNIQYKDGWYRELRMTGERAVTKPSVLGGLAMIPTFVPNDDICGFGGNSYLYALYYKTGTAYYKEVFLDDGLDGDNIKEMVALGPGMPAPFFGTHIGQQEGATALIQLGTGGIESIDVDTPYGLKSGVIFWKEE